MRVIIVMIMAGSSERTKTMIISHEAKEFQNIIGEKIASKITKKAITIKITVIKY